MVRQCYICHGEDIQGTPRDWVSPCRCSGPSRWVHQSCLLATLVQQERRHSFNAAQCAQCQTKIRLWPDVNLLVEAIRLLYDLFSIITIKAFNFIMVIIQIAINIIANSTCWLKFIYSTCWEEELSWRLLGVSTLVIVINNSPWEMFVLRCLRKGSKLPYIGGMFPVKPPPGYRTFEPGDDKWEVSLLGSMLLAPIASYVGDTYFPTDPPLLRFLEGAILYITARGVFLIYYMQKVMIHKAERRVVPFEN